MSGSPVSGSGSPAGWSSPTWSPTARWGSESPIAGWGSGSPTAGWSSLTWSSGISGKLFIISCHGVTFPDSTGKPAKMDVEVDTFTTAKFGHPVSRYIMNTENYSFFNEPHTYFIPEIVNGIHSSHSPPDKDAIRTIITDSLCHTRDKVKVFVPDTCRFMCHKRGTPMAYIYNGSGFLYGRSCSFC